MGDGRAETNAALLFRNNDNTVNPGRDFLWPYFSDYAWFHLSVQFVSKGGLKWFRYWSRTANFHRNCSFFQKEMARGSGHHSTHSVKHAWQFCHKRHLSQVCFLLLLGRLVRGCRRDMIDAGMWIFGVEHA